jgi:hypothetical protein
MQHQVEAGQRACVLRRPLIAAALIAAASLALAAPRLPQDPDGAPHHSGTLIAALVTRSEILLCSDGRVVNSVDRATVREDWPKVHRLTTRAGLLTAGRDLPGLRDRFAEKLGPQRPEAVSAVATVLRGSLEAEWSAMAARSGRLPAGRVFAIVAGFDTDRTPRLYYMDSATAPAFLMQTVPLFDTGQDLEVFAIASNLDRREDASALLVRHLDSLVRQEPGGDRRELMLRAFDAAKRELARRNPTIGGLTFAAAITPAGGYVDVKR